jgi:CRP/FNR family putative post-exponential-phase nitrogen-starvation transcriptional regulator
MGHMSFSYSLSVSKIINEDNNWQLRYYSTVDGGTMKTIHNKERLARYVAENQLDAIFDAASIGMMNLLAYENGEAICSPGDQLDQLFLLVKGKIKVYTTLPNGKSVLLRFNEPLAIIGDMELMTGFPVRCMVGSVGISHFITIKTEALRETAFQDPRFLTFIIKQISYKLHTVSYVSSLNLLYPVENRLSSYLISIMSEDPLTPSLVEMKTEKLTEVAELLGTSYRHLNRVIKQLAADGIIERKRGAIYIRNAMRLRELASGNLYR